MSFTPNREAYGISSPDVFTRDIKCNLINEFEDGETECMNIYARIRPLLSEERNKGFKECIAAVDEKTVRVVVPENSAKYKNSRVKGTEEYTFTAAFGPDVGQFVFFQETMLNCMENFVKGSNSLIFSYGITGSGKTYTLQGNSDNPGIIPLSLKLYFAVLEKQILTDIIVKPSMHNGVIKLSEADQQKEYMIKYELLKQYDTECELVSGSFRNSNPNSFANTLCNLFSDSFEAETRQTTLCAEDMTSAQAATLMKETVKRVADEQFGVCNIWISFVEIYNENIFDLLQPMNQRTTSHRTRLNLGEDKNGNVYIKGAREICVFNSEEALKILNLGRRNLSIASTQMNYQSSRSHCIYTIKVVRIPDRNNLNCGKVSRFSFCDLAGSERTSKTQTSGIRLKEAGSINTSLLVLGRCIEHLRLNQMGRDKRVIPFRESKLTRIFSGFFLGQGKAVMITNASPSDYTFDETLHVLKFSAVAKNLMVSKFFSDVSSSIQSICKEYEMLNNISSCNDSMESVDTDSSIIQMKDNLIEKLLSMVEEFQKKEQEMADLVERVREEVCDEYKEYSDQLLEDRRIRYEEEKETLRQIYEKRLANMEKMYEDIIKGYKDQLSDTEESFASENSVNVSKSHEILEDSLRSEFSESGSYSKLQSEQTKISELEEKIGTLMKELESVKYNAEVKSSMISEFESLTNNLNLKIEELQRMHSSLLTEKEELEKNLAAANEDREALRDDIKFKSSCVRELQEMTNNLNLKIEELQRIHSSLLTEKEELEKNLAAANEDREALRDDIKFKSSCVRELQEEIGMLKKQNEDFQGKIVDLSSAKTLCETDIDNLKSTVTSLNEKLDHTSALEEETQKYKEEIKQLKRNSAEFCNYRLMCENNIKELQSKVSELDHELQTANKTISDMQKELQVKESVSLVLEKEIDMHKQEIKILKENHQNISIEKSELEKKLSSSDANNYQDLLVQLEELKNQIDMHKQEIKILKETHQNISIEKSELEKKLSSSDANNSQDLLVQLEELKNQINKYKEEVKQLKRNSVEFSNYRVMCENDLSKLRNKISDMDQELQTSYKTVNDVQEELKVKKIASLELEKEIDFYKQEIKLLKESHESMSYEKSELEKKLVSIDVMNSQELHEQLEEFENRNKMYELQIITLKEGQENEDNKLKLDLKLANDDIRKKSLKIEDLQNHNKNCELHVEELQRQKENLMSDKLSLEEKITSMNKELDIVKYETQQKSSKLIELENYNRKCELHVEELQRQKENLMSDKLRLEEKITSMNKELNILKYETEQKSSKLIDLENLNNNCESMIEKEKQKYLSLTLEKKQVDDKLVLLTKDLEVLQTNLQIKSSNLMELEEEMKIYCVELENLRKDYQNLQNEKLDIVKEIETEIPVKKMDDDTVEKLQSLNKAVKEFEVDIYILKENLKLIENEKQDLVIIISNKDKKIEYLEEELLRANEQLKMVKDDVLAKTTTIENLKNDISMLKKEVEQKALELEKTKTEHDTLKDKCKELEENLTSFQKDKEHLMEELASLKRILDVLYKLVSVLENCEMQATNKTKQMKTFIFSMKSEVMEQKQQIQSRETSIEELEKGLNDAQVNLKEFQALYQEKKNEVEEIKKEEGNKVKRETLPKKNKSKVSNEIKMETLPKRSASIKEKENQPDAEINPNLKEKVLKKSASVKENENFLKVPSTRSHRQKRAKIQDISFSSVDSNMEAEVPTCRNPKRLSDEDFEPGSRQTSKKMKAASANKIPVRSTRKKVEDDRNKNLSPLQKIAQGVSSKFRNIADNISKISSPVQTRGRKKLFNPDSSSSLKSERVTRGKKV